MLGCSATCLLLMFNSSALGGLWNPLTLIRLRAYCLSSKHKRWEILSCVQCMYDRYQSILLPFNKSGTREKSPRTWQQKNKVNYSSCICVSTDSRIVQGAISTQLAIELCLALMAYRGFINVARYNVFLVRNLICSSNQITSLWDSFNSFVNNHSKFEIVIFRLIDLVIFVSLFNSFILKFSVKLSKLTQIQRLKHFYHIQYH